MKAKLAVGVALLLGACVVHESSCPRGYADCGDYCGDLRFDALDCGACGAACAVADYCSNGLCFTAVKTADASNDNTRVEVKVEHLAPPDRIQSGATTYVVWAQPEGASNAQNIGALKVDNKLKGTLTTVLPYEQFRVFITAEPNAQALEPSGQELLAANVRH